MENSASEKTNQFLELSQNLAAAVERVSPAVVAVDARRRVATTGVLWRPGVIVVTNHTIQRDEEITVTLNDGRVLPATLVGRDASTDLAVLKIDGETSTAELATEEGALKVGHLVLAVGRTGADGVTASFGCVSSVGGPWRTWRGGTIDNFVRLDLSIYLGFSGSPLVGADGRVLGINTSGLARGAALTIPAVTVDRVVDFLLKGGRVARPFIGVGMQPVRLPDKLVSKLNLTNGKGVIVLGVEPGSPADTAGISIGDVLIALNDRLTGDTDDVQAELTPESVGQTIKATLLRGAEKVILDLIVGERPEKKNR